MRRALTLSAASAILAGVTSLAGCTTTPTPSVVVRPLALPIPTRPTLTPIPSSALMCLSDKSYSTLVHRERALRTWALQLRAVIRANNQAASQTAKEAKDAESR
jgi:hypothetical protein